MLNRLQNVFRCLKKHKIALGDRQSSIRSSITPGFENDIFISYCHYDNAAHPNKKGWVDLFHEDLESLLVTCFGPRKVFIWRDKKLQGSTLFDERIQEQIRKSALFFALLSPNYLKSEYCRKELEWFYRKTGDRPEEELNS